MGVASEGVSTSRHFVYCIYSQVGQRGYSNRGGKVDKTKKGSVFFTMQEGSKFQGPMTGPVLAETDTSSGKRSRIQVMKWGAEHVTPQLLVGGKERSG